MYHTLEVDSVQLAFNNKTILSDVYLKSETGVITGLLGRNGSGKSSLLKIIFGTLQADNQSVRLNRKYVPKLYQRPQAAQFLPQENMIPSYLSGRQLLRMFITRSECYETLMQVPEICQYQHLAFGALSTGLQKFWKVMLLLYSNTKFVLMDEPFSGLSPVLIEKLIPHFRQQAQTKGIIVTDHWYETILNLSDNVILLTSGKTRAINRREELYNWGYLRTSEANR